jgi:hypothetical protein
MAVQPTTQQTYSESDLAPISELIKTSQKRGFWSKLDIINSYIHEYTYTYTCVSIVIRM